MLSRLKNLVNYIISLYGQTLSLLLHIRINKVDRQKYVRKMITRCYPENKEEMIEKAMRFSPRKVLTEKQCKNVYKRLVRRSAIIVFLASFTFALVPNILWLNIVVAIVDLAVFQSVVYVTTQKILIIYGNESTLHSEEKENLQRVIAIESSGLMIGKYPLLQKMKSVLGWVSKQVVRRVGPQLVARMSRYVFVAMRRQTIKWFTVILTKENLSLVFDALVPVTCAFISGLVSVVIFIPMCNKLRNHLISEVTYLQ